MLYSVGAFCPAGWQRWQPTDTGQAVHVKFVDGSLLLKMEILKFLVLRIKGKKNNYTKVFSNIEVFRNPDIKVSHFQYLSVLYCTCTSDSVQYSAL